MMIPPDPRFRHGDNGGLYLTFAVYLGGLGLTLATLLVWGLRRRVASHRD